MSNTVIRAAGWAAAAAGVLASPVRAQTIEALPKQFTNLPGNAAMSLPFRWERGMFQVLYPGSLLPSGLAGRTVTAISLRRPAFASEPAYGPVQRTVRIWMASTNQTAINRNTRGNFFNNSPTEVLPPTPISIAASQPGGPGDPVGSTLATFQLATPYVLGNSPNLFIQMEVSAPAFGISPDNWIDAVWLPGNEGLAVEVGNGGCSTVPGATSRLTYTSNEPPGAGRPVNLAASGFAPLAPLFFVGRANPRDPVGTPAFTPGFGLPFVAQGAPNCFSWADPEISEFQFTDGSGAATWSLSIPAGFPGGREFGFQAICLRNLPSLVPSSSNGVVIITNPSGVSQGVATTLSAELPTFPVPSNPTQNYAATFTPFVGLAPIILLHMQ